MSKTATPPLTPSTKPTTPPEPLAPLPTDAELGLPPMPLPPDDHFPHVISPAVEQVAAQIVKDRITDQVERAKQPPAEVTWTPRPSLDNRDGAPADVLQESPGSEPFVRFSLVASRTLTPEVAAERSIVDARLQQKLMTTLEQRPEVAHWLAVRRRHHDAIANESQTRSALSDLERKRGELERKTPVPTNLAARLVDLGAQVDQARAAFQQAKNEADVIAPLFARAEATVKALAPTLVRQAVSDAMRRVSRK